MALTKEFLKEILAGREDANEVAEAIMEAHCDTVDYLNTEINKYRADAEETSRIIGEIERLKASGSSTGTVDENGVSWEERYKAVKAEYDKVKAETERRDAYAEKERAFRSMLLQVGVKHSLVDVIVRGSRETVESIKIEGGRVGNAESIATAIRHDFGDIIGSGRDSAAQDHEAPLTRDGIMSISDRSERLAAIQAHPELFK